MHLYMYVSVITIRIPTKTRSTPFAAPLALAIDLSSIVRRWCPGAVIFFFSVFVATPERSHHLMRSMQVHICGYIAIIYSYNFWDFWVHVMEFNRGLTWF